MYECECLSMHGVGVSSCLTCWLAWSSGLDRFSLPSSCNLCELLEELRIGWLSCIKNRKQMFREKRVTLIYIIETVDRADSFNSSTLVQCLLSKSMYSVDTERQLHVNYFSVYLFSDSQRAELMASIRNSGLDLLRKVSNSINQFWEEDQ